MAQATVSIRMDAELKKQFDVFCKEIGMSMTAAFCVFAKQSLREHKIPFEIGVHKDPFYSQVNQNRLKESIAQMEATGGTVHEVL